MAVLPFSGYLFVRAFTSMRLDAWLNLVTAFEFYGDYVGDLVKSRTGGSRQPQAGGKESMSLRARHQSELCRTGSSLRLCRTACTGAQTWHKAKAETGVQVVERRILAALRPGSQRDGEGRAEHAQCTAFSDKESLSEALRRLRRLESLGVEPRLRRLRHKRRNTAR